MRDRLPVSGTCADQGVDAFLRWRQNNRGEESKTMALESPAADEGTVEPVALASVGAFDHEADVVIVGFGCAGATAAFESSAAGADVLVLERFSGAGGSS